MKRIIFLAFLIPLFLVSCHKHHDLVPVAKFSVDTDKPVVGQDVYFYNDSQNGASYEWDFGDGFISNDAEPVHNFAANGVYNVTLKVVSGSGLEDVAGLDINVVIPTILAIDVLEYYEELPIPNAEVRLYGSKDEWDAANEDWIVMGMTSNNGQVVFSNLSSNVFYVDAYKGYNTAGYDNYTLASEDITFIMTNLVIPNKVNYFTAYVDAVDHTPAKGSRSRSLIIKKLERTPSDKIARQFDTTGWQELYKRSIKVSK